jgi:cytochrome c oxidase subunit 2
VAEEATESNAVVDAVVPAAEASPVAGKTWTKDELVTKGESVYTTACIACHGAEGQGVQGVFPAITGGKIATGDIAAHIDIVMNGKSGTAMVPFVSQLSDEEIASVITYQRNALGNDVGDVVLPADIKALRN